MPSTYIISTGQFLGPDGALVGTCYAGHPPHVNDVTAVGIRNSGPLPPGQYRMLAPIDDPHTVGPFAIPLAPLPDPVDPTSPFGWLLNRSGFYIHGDLIEAKMHPEEASDGCIVPTTLPDGSVNGRAVREAIAAIAQQDDVLNVETGATT